MRRVSERAWLTSPTYSNLMQCKYFDRSSIWFQNQKLVMLIKILCSAFLFLSLSLSLSPIVRYSHHRQSSLESSRFSAFIHSSARKILRLQSKIWHGHFQIHGNNREHICRQLYENVPLAESSLNGRNQHSATSDELFVR
jgi:hypothetical protein